MYQVHFWLEMHSMGWAEWQKCLEIAKAIVAKVREELRLFRETGDKQHKTKADELKKTLPGVCFQASGVEVSIGTKPYNKDKSGRWRDQIHTFLSGLAVIDVDHCDNPRELFESIRERFDLQKLGILLVYVSASGEGLKIVFKARPEWSNLICNQYEMASLLGILDYVDDSCKDSSRLSFLTGPDDVLYLDKEVLFGEETLFSQAEEIIRTDYDLQFGDRYRTGEKGDSSPTVQRWIDFEAQHSKDKRNAKDAKPAAEPAVSEKHAPVEPESIELTERQKAIVAALNGFYGEALGEGKKHPTFCQQTSHWLCYVGENDAKVATAMAYELNYVKNWHPLAGEVEELIQSAAKKKLLKHMPKELKAILEEAGIDVSLPTKAANTLPSDEDLPFGEWIEYIRSLFDIYPCLREICEPHQEKLWPFLFFAAAAFLGTDMTLCYYYFYDQPEKKRRLNYNLLGVGDPAVGKAPLERIERLLTEAMDMSDKVVNDAINEWKESSSVKGANKDKSRKPKGIVRKHGARTSNNIFIGDMVNAFVEIDGERWQLHMLTVDTEALNSIKMSKGGQWIDKQVMEIKAWSNERDSQQYGNLESVTGPFNVYWNQVRTCTPPALKQLANERNFGTGYSTRLYVLPVPDKGFDMIPLRRMSQKALDADEVVRQWGYRMDKRQGELPIWTLVEHAWHWTNDRMGIAAFNDDMADRMLLKRCAVNALCIAAPWVDMRHYDEREKTGTYEPDAQDKALLDLVLDIVYKTQRHYFYELARKYFEEQMEDTTTYRRRTTRFAHCYQKLGETFTTEEFSQVFGYANARSANIPINRLLKDKVIKRVKRGVYKKRVQTID
jgi:hypothetical protein